nr:immunoglobulin light chain junction region [Mus musculus]
CQHSRELPLTF